MTDLVGRHALHGRRRPSGRDEPAASCSRAREALSRVELRDERKHLARSA